jgi:hypothetical protein
MKVQALAVAAALAFGGSAFAQAYSDSNVKHDNGTVHQKAAKTKNTAKSTGGKVVDKTKHALHRAGDATRNLGHRIARATHTDGSRTTAADESRTNETRAMGAAGPDNVDTGRRGRMDESYANWQKRQQQSQR